MLGEYDKDCDPRGTTHDGESYESWIRRIKRAKTITCETVYSADDWLNGYPHTKISTVFKGTKTDRGGTLVWDAPYTRLNICAACSRPTPYMGIYLRGPWIRIKEDAYSWITKSKAPDGESWRDFERICTDNCLKCVLRRYKELLPTWEMLSIKKQLTEIGRAIRCKQQAN